MKNLLLIIIVLLTIIDLHSQTNIKLKDFPKNTISLTTNQIISTAGKSAIMYKRMLNLDKNKVCYLRLSFVIDSDYMFPFDWEYPKNRVNNLDIAYETLKYKDKFSLSYGVELGMTFVQQNKGVILVRDSYDVFSNPKSYFWRGDSQSKVGRMIMLKPTVFSGFKYHFNENIAIGLEGAFAFAAWFSKTTYIEPYNKPDKNTIYSGLVFDTALIRYFSIEYSF